MGKALYRRYRSKKLSEIVGQEHITSTLEQALKLGRISHAYLFTGPRGVGKTSIARILAHEINKLPYDDDAGHIDIIEIDAASNRRIDEIRDLRDKVHVAPASVRYKVYIIDEVHMLTREAFNALLKTLEEPPEHVVFILATTEAHKLPETIISRTQRYSFRPVEKAKVIEHLKHIAEQEKITVSQEALELLAEHGEGSFRDSIGLLDQASSHGKSLTVEAVRQLLGIPPQASVQQLLELLREGASSQLVSSLESLYNQGFQAAAVAKEVSHSLRQQIIDGQAPHTETLQLLQLLVETPAAYNPERYLELVLLQAQASQAASAPPPVAAPAVVAEVAVAPAAAKAGPAAAAEPAEAKLKSGSAPDESLWPQLLQALKQKHNTLYGVIRMAQPRFNEDRLELAFAFAFHQKRINEAANRKLLSNILQELTGQSFVIECRVDKTAKPPKTTALKTQPASKNDLKAISNIFGGGELLES